MVPLFVDYYLPIPERYGDREENWSNISETARASTPIGAALNEQNRLHIAESEKRVVTEHTFPYVVQFWIASSLVGSSPRSFFVCALAKNTSKATTTSSSKMRRSRRSTAKTNTSIGCSTQALNSH